MNSLYKNVFVIIIFIGLVACQNTPTDSTPDSLGSEPSGISIDQNQFSSSKFELGKIEERPFSKMLNATGVIDVHEKSKAAVSSFLGGTVGTMKLIEGQWVNKGQKLFSITNPELINLQEAFLIAKGELAYLSEEYDRQLDLSTDNLSTKKEVLEAKSRLTTTQARYGSLKKKLNLYGINTDQLSTDNLVSSLAVLSPISGYISELNVIRGMHIEPEQSALIVTNTSQMYLELSVLEKDALSIKKGQHIAFTLQGNPTKTYNATVELINKSIDSRHMISVNCKIADDEKTQLIPGMYANAQIVLTDYIAKALPESAVVKLDEAYYLLVLKTKDSIDLVFDKVAVQTGEIHSGYIELNGSIDETAQYLTKGAYYLIQ